MVTSSSIVALTPSAVGASGHFVVGLGDEYVEEWLSWHANNVCSTELACSPHWLKEMGDAINKKCGLIRLNLGIVQYDKSNVLHCLRPQPDQCRFISVPELRAYGKNTDVLDASQKALAQNRNEVLGAMVKRISLPQSLKLLRMFETNVVRLGLQKSLNGEFLAGVTGKFEVEKIHNMRMAWLRHCEKQVVALKGLGGELGLELETEDASLADVLEPVNFKDYAFVPSLNAELIAAGLIVGAKVKLVRRITVEFKAGAGGRKDISIGEEAYVKGMAEGNLVITIRKDVNGHEMEADVATKASSVTLVDAKLGGTVGGAAASKLKAPKGFEYLDLAGAKTFDVLKCWQKLQACEDPDAQKGRIVNKVQFGLGLLLEQQDEYSEKDFTIATIDSKVTVWAHRDFAAHDLVLLPDTNEIKDRFWTLGRSSLIKGSDAIMPQGKHLALDGRCRSVPSALRPFALFFAIERTSEKAKVNLVTHYGSLSGKLSIQLPNSEKVDRVLKAKEFGEVPVLTNPKKIKKGTRLWCEDAALKRVAEKMSEEKAKTEAAKKKADEPKKESKA